MIRAYIPGSLGMLNVMEHVWNMYGQIVEERTKTYNLERYFSLFRTKTSENVCKIHIFDRNFAFLPALQILRLQQIFYL